MEKYYEQLKQNFIKIQNKVELGIKVFYKIAPLLKEEPVTDSTGKAYFLKKYNQYLDRKSKLEPYINRVGNIHSRLAKLAHDSCCTNPLRNNLLMNASYLVSRDMADIFSEDIEHIKEEYNAFKIVYSGPWPPYHFVKVKEEGDENE